MCRNGGTSMTRLEQRNNGAAPLHSRIAVSNRCWRAWVLLALLTSSAQAAAPNANQQTDGDNTPAISSPSGGDATSSRAARDEALRAIPWKSMSPAARQTSQSIINNTSIYRRLPTRIIDSAPDL